MSVTFGFEVGLDVDQDEERFINDEKSFVENQRYDAAFIHIFNMLNRRRILSKQKWDIYVFYKDEKDIAECRAANLLKVYFKFSLEGNEIPNACGDRICFRKIGADDVVKYGGADIGVMYFIGLQNFEKREFEYLITRIRRHGDNKRSDTPAVKGIAPIGEMPEWVKAYERDFIP